MDKEYIQNYLITKPLGNENSGFAKWGFAKKDDIEYFIKEFLSPIWPVNSSEITETQRQIRQTVCDNWVTKKKNLYNTLKSIYSNNIVAPVDFFRNNSHYYLVTEKIEQSSISYHELYTYSIEQKMTFCRALSYSLMQLHTANIVHCDLKPENILIKETTKGYFTAKIIDFDSSFLESEPPESGDDIQCDPTYMSPELFLKMIDEEVTLSTKSDVFSMGIIFHYIWSNSLPIFSDEYDYLYEAVLDDAHIEISDLIPARIKHIISLMLSQKSINRIDMNSVFQLLKLTTDKNIFIPPISQSSKPQDSSVKKNILKPSSDIF